MILDSNTADAPVHVIHISQLSVIIAYNWNHYLSSSTLIAHNLQLQLIKKKMN